jgi:hypothetical protein
MPDAGITMKRPPGINLVIGLGIFSAVAITLYWITWFTAPQLIQARSPAAPDYSIYVNFELSFLLADAWLATASLVGVIGLIKMRDWGFLFGLLAGGAAIFLGLMDLLYDLQHNMFTPLTAEALTELLIVILLLTLSPLQISILWKNRKLFL